MKLRLEAKSIRIRLSEEEFDLIQKGNRLTEKIIAGPDNQFSFALTAGNYSTVQARFSAYKLEVKIPFSVLKNWATSGETGISTTRESGQETVKPVIIIEKDLPPRRKKTD